MECADLKITCTVETETFADLCESFARCGEMIAGARSQIDIQMASSLLAELTGHLLRRYVVHQPISVVTKPNIAGSIGAVHSILELVAPTRGLPNYAVHTYVYQAWSVAVLVIETLKRRYAVKYGSVQVSLSGDRVPEAEEPPKEPTFDPSPTPPETLAPT